MHWEEGNIPVPVCSNMDDTATEEQSLPKFPGVFNRTSNPTIGVEPQETLNSQSTLEKKS